MTSRERVLAAYAFEVPDVVPVEYAYSAVGIYEHGEKLNQLFGAHPGDFEPFKPQAIPVLGPECFDEQGRYHQKITDEWGTEWEYRIYGIAGIESAYPLDDWGKLADYRFPPQPAWVTDPAAFAAAQAAVKAHQQTHFYRHGTFSLFERLIALRPFEDVLCDLMTDDPYLIQLLDRLTAYYEQQITALIRMGVDCIHFGDDFGTQENLIFSLDIFRTHFKPRYERLMKPIREAGIKISFHSCGMIRALLPELQELGVNALWPQLPLYDMETFAEELRERHIALAIHTDRANTMTYGTPDDVRELVKREFAAFRPDKGGSWFYIEADNGMPFENIQALVEQIYQYR